MFHVLVALKAYALTITDRLNEDEQGAAVVEYGIVLAFVVIALGGILLALGEPIGDWFGRIATEIGSLEPTS